MKWRIIASINEQKFPAEGINKAIEKLLNEIGMLAGLSGYEYARYGILLVMEDATISRRMMGAFYPAGVGGVAV